MSSRASKMELFVTSNSNAKWDDNFSNLSEVHLDRLNGGVSLKNINNGCS